MFRKLICSIAIVLTASAATFAGAEESLWSKLCNNDVPDCICRWCCPSYCRKPEPRVCGPLPPHLTCKPKGYVPYWREHPTLPNPCGCDPGCSSAIGATFLEQPRSMDYAHPRDTRVLPAEGPRLDVPRGRQQVEIRSSKLSMVPTSPGRGE